MAEGYDNNERTPEPEDHEDLERQDHDEKEEVSSEEERMALADIFLDIVSAVDLKTSSGGEDKKLFYEIVNVALGDKPASEGGHAEERLAELIHKLTENKEPEDGTDDPLVQEESDGHARMTTDIVQALRNYAQDEHSGLNEALVFDKINDFAAGDAPEPQPKLQQYEYLHWMLATSLKNPTADTMQKLLGEWEALNSQIELSNPLKLQVIEAVVLLERSAQSNTMVETDAVMLQMLGRIIAHHGEAVSHTALEKTPEADFSLIERTILFAGDSKQTQEAKLAALLKEYPTTGKGIKEQQEAVQIRGKILDYAEKKGLNFEQIAKLSEQPQVMQEDGETGTSVTEFVNILADEIVTADASKIAGILHAWEEMRDMPGLDPELRERAIRGVAMLEKIHAFKLMQEANPKGHVRRVTRPDALEEEHDVNEDTEEKDKEKKGLIKILAALFATADIRSGDHEKTIVRSITELVLSSKDTGEEKQQLLNAIAACFPVARTGRAQYSVAALQGYLAAYAYRNGFEFPEVFVDEAVSDEHSQNAFEGLLQVTFKDIATNDLSALNHEWKTLLANEDLQHDRYAKEHVLHAVGIMDSLLPKPTPDARQHPLEQPVSIESSTETDIHGQFSRDMRELVHMIDPKGRMGNDEKATLVSLYRLVTYSSRSTNKEFAAEENIAEILAAFDGQPEKIKLLRGLMVCSSELGLNMQKIKHEEMRVIAQEHDARTPLDIVEQIIYEQAQRVHELSSKEAKALRGEFATLLTTIDADSPAHAIAQEAATFLDTLMRPEEKDIRASDERSTHRAFVHALAETRTVSSHLPLLADYLDALETRLTDGTMTHAQMDAALKRLDELVMPVADDVKNQLISELQGSADRGFLESKFRNLVAVEEITADYKKLLIEGRNKETVFPEAKKAGSKEEKETFLAETAEIAELTTEQYGELDASRLTRYIVNLEHLLKNPAQLSVEQLQTISTALEIQDAVVRGQLTQENKFIEALTLYERVKDVRLDIYTYLSMQRKGEDRSAEEIIDAANRDAKEVLPQEVAVGVNMYRPVTPDPRDPQSGAAFHPDTPEITSAVHNLRELSDSDTQIDELLDEAPGLTPDARDYFAQNIRRLNNPEERVYASEAGLSQLQNELDQLVDQARARAAASGDTFSFESIPRARQLAQDIMNQRIALAAQNGYRGIVEKRNEQDEALYTGDIDQVLQERMRRIAVQFGAEPPRAAGEHYSDKQLHAYYKELQRWVTIVLKNDVVDNPDRVQERGNLRLTPQERKRYLKIKNREVTEETIRAQQHYILDDITALSTPADSGRAFLDYFKSIPDPSNQEGASRANPRRQGIPYQRPQEMRPGGYGIPESVQETMQLAADQYSINNEADYHTGGNRELIDAEGNFQYHNFVDLIRTAIQRDIDNNGDSQIDPFQKFAIKLPLGQIGLYELLYLIPEYLSERRFVISQDDRTGQIVSGWGPKLEHQGLTWGNAAFIVAEVETRQKGHVDRAVGQGSTSKEAYVKWLEQVFGGRLYERANNGLYFNLGVPSVNDGKEGFDKWVKGEQGSMGLAQTDILVGIGYLPEIAKYHTIKEPPHSGEKREKYFNENMFYKWWEADGTMIFQRTMAEGALNKHKGAKDVYAAFIKKRIDAAGADYIGRANESQQELIRQYIADYKAKLDGGAEVKFTESQHLSDFHRLIRGVVLDEAIDEEKLANEVKTDLLTNLRDGYFGLLMTTKVRKIVGKDKYRNLKVGDELDFGDVKLNVNGREVTMEDFLMGNSDHGLAGFVPEQITKFDYRSGDDNDPIEMKKREWGRDLTEAEARDVLDRFMLHTSDNHKLFEANETMMLEFAKYFAQLDRSWFNYMQDIPGSKIGKQLVEGAFMACVSHQRRLEKREAKYIMGWGYDTAVNWGMRGMLDYHIGYDYSARIWHTGAYLSQRGGKDHGGILELMDQINAMGAAYPYMLRVLKMGENATSLHALMQGGQGGYITPRGMRKFDNIENYTIEREAGWLYVENHVKNAADLVDLLGTLRLKMAEVLKISEFSGDVEIDRDKATALFKEYRKPVRYAFQKNGMDYGMKVWLDGKETTMYNHCFGKKIREINEAIIRNTDRSLADIYDQPGDGVMLAMFAAAVHDARKQVTMSPRVTITDTIKIMHWLLEYMKDNDLEVDDDGDPVAKVKKHPINEKIFDDALKSFETGFDRMMRTELASTFFIGLLIGLKEGLTEYSKSTFSLAA